MRSKLFQVSLLVVCLPLLSQSGLASTPSEPVAGLQKAPADAQKYAGTWAGSYNANDGDGGTLSYLLSKDEKGQWRGTIKFTNKEGEQQAEMKSLQIADGKFSAKIESPDGEAQVNIEGSFQGDRLEGTYAVSPKGSTEVVERGTWKVARSPQAGK